MSNANYRTVIKDKVTDNENSVGPIRASELTQDNDHVTQKNISNAHLQKDMRKMSDACFIVAHACKDDASIAERIELCGFMLSDSLDEIATIGYFHVRDHDELIGSLRRSISALRVLLITKKIRMERFETVKSFAEQLIRVLIADRDRGIMSLRNDVESEHDVGSTQSVHAEHQASGGAMQASVDIRNSSVIDMSNANKVQTIAIVPDANPVSTARKVSPVRAKSDSDRRVTVITLLKKKGTAQIRDIAREIPGYSEKTIQRELASLVRDGVAKKSGDRRWTVYELV